MIEEEIVFDSFESGQKPSIELSIEEVYEVVKDKPAYRIKKSSFANEIISALRHAAKELGEEFDYPNREENPVSKHYCVRTVHEDAILNHAELVSRLDSYEEPSDFKEIDYTYGYFDLGYDEFCAYISWRTSVRTGEFLPCPNGFLSLYLMELCNFIEYDSCECILQHIRILEDSYSTDKKKNAMIKQALFEFTALYSYEIEMTLDEKWQVWRIKNSEQLKNGDYTNAYDFLVPMYTYKGQRKGVANPFLNEEDEPVLRKLFPLVLYDVNKLFISRGIDLLNLFCGRTLCRTPYLKYVKEIKIDAVKQKQVFPIRDTSPECYISVSFRQNETFQVLCQYQQELDSDGTVFFDHSILLFLLNSFLNGYYRFAGKECIDDRRDDLINRPYSNSLRGDIVDMFLSDSFRDTIWNTIVNSGVELSKRNIN